GAISRVDFRRRRGEPTETRPGLLPLLNSTDLPTATVGGVWFPCPCPNPAHRIGQQIDLTRPDKRAVIHEHVFKNRLHPSHSTLNRRRYQLCHADFTHPCWNLRHNQLLPDNPRMELDCVSLEHQEAMRISRFAEMSASNCVSTVDAFLNLCRRPRGRTEED